MLRFGLLFASVVLVTEVAAFSFTEMTADDWITPENFLMERASVDGTNLCSSTGGRVSLDTIGDFTLINAEGKDKLDACSTTVLGPEYSYLKFTCFVRLEFGSRFTALVGSDLFSFQCPTKEIDCFLQGGSTAPSDRASVMLTSGQRFEDDYFYCQVEAVQGLEGPSDNGPPDDGPPNDDPSYDDGPFILDTCDCGIPVASRIVDGQLADDNEYPFASFLFVTTSQGGRFFCGGTLVSDRFILTAAHCTAPDASIVAVLGTNTLSPDGATEVGVEQVFAHPDYNDVTLQFDFALLKLDTVVDFAANPRVRPVCLPQGCDSYAGTIATAIGWGLTNFNETLADDLLEVEVPVINNGDCSKIWSHIDDSIICAGESGRGTCFGDSGGALLSKVSGPYFELIGVTSFGNAFCSQLAGGFGRVTELLPWIFSIISDSSTCQTPS